MRTRWVLGCVGAALLAWLGTACGGGGGSNVSSSMLWVGATASQSAAWLAAEGGYFRQNGVDMDLSFQSGSPTAAASLAGGHVDFVQMAGPAVVTANAKGAHLTMVMGIVTKPTFVLMTSPEVRTPDQLKGKTIGVVQVGSSDDFMLRAGLGRWGLQADRDVKIVPLQSIQGQIAAFQKHLVQGLVVDPPNDLLATRAGAHLLARIADLGIPYQAAGLVTTQSFLRDHRGTVTRVVQAMVQAVHRFKTDQKFAKQVMARYLKTNDGATLQDAYDEFAQTFPQVPLPSQAGLEEIVRLDVQAGTIKAPVSVSSLADPSIVTELQKNGFIQRVYGA